MNHSTGLIKIMLFIVVIILLSIIVMLVFMPRSIATRDDFIGDILLYTVSKDPYKSDRFTIEVTDGFSDEQKLEMLNIFCEKQFRKIVFQTSTHSFVEYLCISFFSKTDSVIDITVYIDKDGSCYIDDFAGHAWKTYNESEFVEKIHRIIQNNCDPNDKLNEMWNHYKSRSGERLFIS